MQSPGSLLLPFLLLICQAPLHQSLGATAEASFSHAHEEPINCCTTGSSITLPEEGHQSHEHHDKEHRHARHHDAEEAWTHEEETEERSSSSMSQAAMAAPANPRQNNPPAGGKNQKPCPPQTPIWLTYADVMSFMWKGGHLCHQRRCYGLKAANRRDMFLDWESVNQPLIRVISDGKAASTALVVGDEAAVGRENAPLILEGDASGPLLRELKHNRDKYCIADSPDNNVNVIKKMAYSSCSY